MSNQKNNPVLEVLSKLLKEAGFKKKADTWYREADDAISIVNLQKSQYGRQYYVNVAVYLKQIGDIQFPKEYHCHIRSRLSSLVPETEKSVVEKAFDLEDDLLSEEERKQKIAEALKMHVLTFLDALSSLPGIKEAYRSSKLSKALVHKKVKDLMD